MIVSIPEMVFVLWLVAMIWTAFRAGNMPAPASGPPSRADAPKIAKLVARVNDAERRLGETEAQRNELDALRERVTELEAELEDSVIEDWQKGELARAMYALETGRPEEGADRLRRVLNELTDYDWMSWRDEP